jgi:hypothetical protein
VGTLAFVLGTARVAAAQEPAPPPPAPTPPPRVSAAPSTEEASDHDRFVGHIGVTYFDVTNLPIATPGGAAGPGTGTVAAPVVGIRYWLQRSVGLDLGLGVGWQTTAISAKQGGMNVYVPDPSFPFGIALHAGLPLQIAGGQHYAFLIVPETTFGYATETIKGMNGNPDQNFSGVLFNLGARAGAEIHFGFIGIPQLALQGSIGLLLSYQQYGFSSGSGATQVSASQSGATFGTTVPPAPWAIFTDAISATYYL